MAELGTCPSPPVLRRDGFQICRGRFSVRGVGRCSASRLTELFKSQSLRLKRDETAAAESARLLFKKPFFAAQLKFYGIHFTSSARAHELRELLESAVLQDKCRNVPESVIHLEESLQKEYEPLLRKWEQEVSTHKAKKKQQEDDAFAKCETPGERANCDLDRFLDYYFFTDGQPDLKKTKTPLALYGFRNRSQLHARAERIDGLETASGGSEPDRTICIGWNSSAVWRLASDIDHQAAKAKKKEEDMRWESAMEAHRQYISQMNQGSSSLRAKSSQATKIAKSQSFDLEQCQGSYIIRCQEVKKNWPDISEGSLTLDISKGKGGIMIANYDFGMIKGTMILSLSEETLDAIAGIEADDESHSDSSRSDSYPLSDSEVEDYPKPRKRLAQDVASASVKARKKTGPTAKKRKLAPSLSRRVYYRMRGRETGEGQIYPDIEAGHLDFFSGECNRFAGLAYEFPFISSNVEFQGYKVSSSPRRKPEGWNAFSYEAYENSRARRWY